MNVYVILMQAYDGENRYIYQIFSAKEKAEAELRRIDKARKEAKELEEQFRHEYRMSVMKWWGLGEIRDFEEKWWTTERVKVRSNSLSNFNLTIETHLLHD